MDCFFAAIEIRGNPSLANRPVAVGGLPEHRGVLSTCNYEARKFGLHSAMPSSQALKKCPQLILIPGRYDFYKAESEKIAEILRDYTTLIEPIGLDESYLDVTDSLCLGGSATLMAQEIRDRIWKMRQLRASAGIAENKFLAKIASDWKKPNGQFTIPPEQSAAFAAALPIGKIPGVGKVGEKKLNEIGVFLCSDILSKSIADIVSVCGTFGFQLYQFAKGIDRRPVIPDRKRKSLSTEDTFDFDISELTNCLKALERIYDEFLRRLHVFKSTNSESLLKKSTVKCFVKIKYSDFSQTTIERSFPNLEFENFAQLLKERYELVSRPVRLLGLGIRLPETEEAEQLEIEFENFDFRESQFL